jgi:hypothetical protein
MARVPSRHVRRSFKSTLPSCRSSSAVCATGGRRTGKNAVKWTRLSCATVRANAVRLQLHALAYNLADGGQPGVAVQ